MSYIDSPPSPEDQEPHAAEKALEAQIDMCLRLTETAFKHVAQMGNAAALAGVTRALDLLISFLPEAERLRDKNRPAAYARLTLLVDDVTAARNTWAQTLGILVAADQKDTKNQINYRNTSTVTQQKLNEVLFKQAETHAKEGKKIL